jgi:cytochrome P450
MNPEMKDFDAKAKSMLMDRLKLGKSRQDVFTHLLGEDVETGTVFTEAELAANAQLMIVAGAGTLSSEASIIGL